MNAWSRPKACFQENDLVSLNAIANLGYAELRFLAPVFSGDTLRCESVVIDVD